MSVSRRKTVSAVELECSALYAKPRAEATRPRDNEPRSAPNQPTFRHHELPFGKQARHERHTVMHRCLIGAWLLLACGRSHSSGSTEDGSRDASPNTSPNTSPGGDANPACEPKSGDVDLLFVIDNSGSMSEEQYNLKFALPHMMQRLAAVDHDGDGIADTRAVRSLHVGVVNTDMGVGGHVVPGCREPNFGDDGVLRTQGDPDPSHCEGSYPPFQALELRSEMSADDLAHHVGCVLSGDTSGCGFEQPLEAMLKAITPSSSATEFHMQTRGHADRANAGFVRRDAVLAVVIVADEDDCSFRDADLVNPQSIRYAGDLNLRCSQHPDAISPVQRYVDGLLALKSDPSRIVFAPITGVPNRLVMLNTDFDAMLADPDMQEIPDPAMPTRLRPSCNRPGTGLAFPPRRIVSVARNLAAAGATSYAASICLDDLSSAAATIANKILGAISDCR